MLPNQPPFWPFQSKRQCKNKASSSPYVYKVKHVPSELKISLHCSPVNIASISFAVRKKKKKNREALMAKLKISVKPTVK